MHNELLQNQGGIRSQVSRQRVNQILKEDLNLIYESKCLNSTC